MTYYGRRAESFIVRIWLEPRETRQALPELRGMLERVTTGEKRYFNNLADMLQYMLAYLERDELKEDPS